MYSAEAGTGVHFDKNIGQEVARFINEIHPQLSQYDGGYVEDEDEDEEFSDTDVETGVFASDSVYLVGFDIATFAKLAAAESAESGCNDLPQRLWLNHGYRDLDGLLRPGRWAKKVAIQLSLSRLEIADFENGKPGVNSKDDLRVCLEVANALNLAPALRESIANGVDLVKTLPAKKTKLKVSA